MKLLFLIILLSGSEGLAGPHAAGLVKAEQPHMHEGQMGVRINDSDILGGPWPNLRENTEPCYDEDDVFLVVCSTGGSCTINCYPGRRGQGRVSWTKNCTSPMGSSDPLYFQKLTTNDAGYYTCREGAEVYTHKLKVNDGRVVLDPEIDEPKKNATIEVDVGKPHEVKCVAVFHSEPDLETIYWMNRTSSIPRNSSKPVSCNKTIEPQKDGKYHMISWLVFRPVSREHLSTEYICKLETANGKLVSVSIKLKQRDPSPFLWLWIVATFAVTASVFMVIYVKLKVDIVLLLRELKSASSSVSDGKQYDAYIMYYKAASEDALTEEEQRLIPHVLETEFGYRLCLFERDILPGTVVQEAVLEHIAQSRRLVLLPGTLEAEQESWVRGVAGGGAGDEQALLNGLHAALVDRQTRLILVERAPHGELDSLPESLQLLFHSGGAVVWRGERSQPLSSPFWKKLRYYMPAQQCQKQSVNRMTAW